MARWLLEISFGPVQGFIEAARKSRDLYAGSYLLSEVVRAAALELTAGGAELIYPVKERVETKQTGDISNLSNILLVSLNVDSTDQVRSLAAKAAAAGRSQLKKMAEDAFREYEMAKVHLHRQRFDDQLAEALESFAAWAEVHGDDYRQAYDKVKSSLSARKNTRDFAPAKTGTTAERPGSPKSSLDGKWETVLPDKNKLEPRSLRRFDLSEGEQLDAIGAVKRHIGTKRQFVPLSRLAVHPWLLTLTAEELESLRDAYHPLVEDNLASSVRGMQYKGFPMDGGLLFPDALQAQIDEAKREQNRSSEQKLLALQQRLRPLWRKHGSPCPYAAMVMADGDRMGAFVDLAKTAEQHSFLSKAVADFAAEAPTVVERYGGQAIYAGGEDLLLLLPLQGAVPACRELAALFDRTMQPAALRLGAKDKTMPTLRCGAALAHILEPFSLIRHYAKEAEVMAKGEAGTARQGNAAGIDLHVRAGHRISARLRFDDQAGFQTLSEYIEAYQQGRLPARLAYETGAIARRLDSGEFPADSAEAELRLLLSRARQSGGAEKVDAEQTRRLLGRFAELQADERTGAEALHKLSDELILARWLSARSEREVAAL